MFTFARRVLVSGVMTGLLAVTAGIASADVSFARGGPPGSCANAAGGPWLCLYELSNYRGSPGKFQQSNGDLRKFGHSGCGTGTWNDCAVSVWNQTANCWELHDEFNGQQFTGSYHNLAPHDGYADLSTIGFDGKISSLLRSTSTRALC